MCEECGHVMTATPGGAQKCGPRRQRVNLAGCAPAIPACLLLACHACAGSRRRCHAPDGNITSDTGGCNHPSACAPSRPLRFSAVLLLPLRLLLLPVARSSPQRRLHAVCPARLHHDIGDIIERPISDSNAANAPPHLERLRTACVRSDCCSRCRRAWWQSSWCSTRCCWHLRATSSRTRQCQTRRMASGRCYPSLRPARFSRLRPSSA